jgi:hypothetical protein
VPGCQDHRLRLTHVDGPLEPYPVQRTVMLPMAKAGHRLADPGLEILRVKHHLRKIDRHQHRQRPV